MSNVLKNGARELLFQDSDPGKIIDRKEQIRTLKTELFSDLKEGKKTIATTYIYGSSGTGKTYVTKQLQEQNKKDAEDHNVNIKSIFFNGRNYTTEHRLVVKIASMLEEYFPTSSYDKDYVPPQGISSTRLLTAIGEAIDENDLTFLMVIDEIDKIDRGAIQKIIAMTHDYHSQKDLPIHMIAISNDPYFLDDTPQDVERRVGQKIHFPKYGTNELFDILKYYAQFSVKNYQDKDLIDIAKRVHETTGSASDVKKMLYYTAKRSEESLNTDYINKAEQKVEKNELKEEITTKPDQQVVILLSLAKVWKKYEGAKAKRGDKTARRHIPTTKKVHNFYKKQCEKYDMKVRSMRTLRRFIRELQKDNMVSTELKGFGRGRGVSTVVELLHDPDVIQKITKDVLELEEL